MFAAPPLQTGEVAVSPDTSPRQPSRRLRVLHLTTEFPPVIYGGLGTAVGGLVNASIRSGIDARVFMVADSGREGYSMSPLDRVGADSEAAQAGQAEAADGFVAVYQAGHRAAVDSAVNVVRSWRPDVIHLHSFWLAGLARALQEQTGTPLVYTVHSLDKAEYDLGEGPPECLSQWETQQFIINAADRVIALTPDEQRLIGEYCPGARERVRVVGNGIADTCQARRAAARARDDESPLILYSGRFVERKGITDLLDAIPQVLDRVPTARFVLAGGHRHCSGADMERRWLPESARLYRDRIHFTGWLTPEQVDEWYRAADILVVPSWYEPFGMVVLEGMLNGVAVAAAEVGGPEAILDHRRTGWLFPPRDPRALASALVELSQNRVHRHSIAYAGAREVRRTWLWPQVVRRMQGVYAELAGVA